MTATNPREESTITQDYLDRLNGAWCCNQPEEHDEDDTICIPVCVLRPNGCERGQVHFRATTCALPTMFLSAALNFASSYPSPVAYPLSAAALCGMVASAVCTSPVYRNDNNQVHENEQESLLESFNPSACRNAIISGN